MLIRPKLAFFSPLPPVKSGIADYSWALLPALAHHFDITLFLDSYNQMTLDLAIAHRFEKRPISDYEAQRWAFDAALFQIGNHPYHEELYKTFIRFGGVATLHELNIHHLAALEYRSGGRDETLLNLISPERSDNLLDYVNLRSRADLDLSLSYPLNERMIEMALGLLSHSHFVATHVAKIRSDLPVSIMPQPMPIPEAISAHRPEGISDDAFVFAAAGQISKLKQIDVALSAFAKIHAELPHTHFVLIGEPIDRFDVHTVIKDLRLDEAVTITGFEPDLNRFMAWICGADLLINLRAPTLGETSASVLRGMGVGVPPLVYDHGWYQELPDEALFKVVPDDHDLLEQTMRQAVMMGDGLRQKGARAHEHIKTLHTPSHAAKIVADFLFRIYRL